MNPSILIIEDDPGIGGLLQTILIMYTPHVAWATTGREGLRQANADRPDVILLDIRLPDINGLDVLAQLRSAPQTAIVPIITMTAFEYDALQMFRAGATRHLSKSDSNFTNPEALWALIQQCARERP